MTSQYDTVVVPEVEMIRSTDKAGLYRTVDGEEIWIPFSQLKEGSIDKDGDSGDIYIPLWLAEEKELDYHEID